MVTDQHLEEDERPSGAIAVLGVAVGGLLALPLVVLAAHALGLGWVWAGVLGLSTPSVLLVLCGLALVATGPAAAGAAVVPLRDRRPGEPPAQVAAAA